ncbi:hypothetical protein NDU88_005675 [Pleurodeles waltl]|uniref:Uncharacterized protein n=1 Tax=Pleurodeles waltl TaxID=8319 RepID=A0AAV7WE19_PLEWA|nr:hypothetical protein NDU88_005675 [Pleurodeles waltl]
MVAKNSGVAQEFKDDSHLYLVSSDGSQLEVGKLPGHPDVVMAGGERQAAAQPPPGRPQKVLLVTWKGASKSVCCGSKMGLHVAHDITTG